MKHPNRDQNMFKGAPSENFGKAERLRISMTSAEKILWEKFRNKQFQGLKFRRQHPVHRFRVDFYCHKLGLVIEVEGGYHEGKEQKALDTERESLLQSQSLEILRFTNEQVINKLEEVLSIISDKLKKMEVEIYYYLSYIKLL